MESQVQLNQDQLQSHLSGAMHSSNNPQYEKKNSGTSNDNTRS